MSIIQDITNPATSVPALVEVGQNAHFGDSIAQWGNKAADPQSTIGAVQETENMQPIYLPKDSGGAYAYLPGLNGNGLSVGSVADSSLADEMVVTAWLTLPDPLTTLSPILDCGFRSNNAGFYLLVSNVRDFRMLIAQPSGIIVLDASSVAGYLGMTVVMRFSTNVVGATITGTGEISTDNGETWVDLGSDSGTLVDYVDGATAPSIGDLLTASNNQFGGKITRVTVEKDGLLEIDVNIPVDATHGETSFTATSGQTVTVVGDQTKIIGHSLIRHEGIDDFLVSTLDASRSNLHAWFVLQHHTSQDFQRAFSIDSDNLSSPQFDEFAGAYRVGGNSNNWGDVLERNILEVRWTNLGNACAFYIDGVAQFTTGAVSFSTLKLFLAGFTSVTFPHAAVDYEAIYVANGILNNEESAAITEAINKKYNVYS